MNTETQKVLISADLTGSKVFIVSPFVVAREAIASLITERTNATCICVNSCSDVFQSSPDHFHPVLILLDCAGKSFEACIDEFTREGSTLIRQDHVALYNVHIGTKVEDRCLNEGVRGVLYEDAGVDIFIKGVCALSKGELWFSRESMTKYILEERDNAGISLRARQILTGREIEILSLLAIGCKNYDIAVKLCISPHTIKTHLYNIYKKINVSNRFQAILWAAKNL